MRRSSARRSRLASRLAARTTGACLAAGLLTAAAAGQGALTSLASVRSGGEPTDAEARFADVSANGRIVAFSSEAVALVPGDTNGVDDVFVHDRVSGLTTRVSVSTGGVEANARSRYAAVSADGRWVTFVSLSDKLAPGVPAVGTVNVYLRDRKDSTTTLLSANANGESGDKFSTFPRISQDGLFVAFISAATNLIPGETDGQTDIYVRDVAAGTLEVASVSSAGVVADQLCHQPDISADGRWVTFAGIATNLVPGDTNGVEDVFLRDRLTGTTTRVSVATGGAQATGDSYKPSISGDGRWIVFTSDATDLVPGDTNGVADIFLHDALTGTTTRISESQAGVQGDGPCEYGDVSSDGEWLLYVSAATNLVPGDANGASDAFRRHRASGATQLCNLSTLGVQGDAGCIWPRLSGDGSVAVFESFAANLVPGDTNGVGDVVVRDFTACPMPARYCVAKTNSQGCQPRLDWLGTPSLSGADDFQVVASGVLNQHPGLLIWGHAGQSVPFMGGTLCVVSPQRTPGQLSGGSPPPTSDCSGSYAFLLSHAFLAANGLGAGDVLMTQYWSRDTGFAPPNAVGLTGALQVLVCP